MDNLYSKKQLIKKSKQAVVSPTRLVVISFVAVILVGTFLLMLPISTRDANISFLDALFTATSATCVTGLVVFDTYSKFTFFGQIIILTLIQIGGLGLVSFTTFFAIASGKKLGFKSLKIASFSSSFDDLGELSTLFLTIFKIVFVCEFIGFILISLVLVPDLGLLNGLWVSFFTSVSAFCNAGFDLFGQIEPYTSLVPYYDNYLMNFTIMGLIVSGGLGFMVWHDVITFRKLGKLKLSYHSKLVINITAILILTGAAVILFLEWNNPNTIKNLPLDQKILASLFQSVTTRTAGFNTIDQAGMTDFSKLFSSFLMFIGAAPGGTGGGIKITTFAVILITVVSVIKGRNDAIYSNHKINTGVVYRALAIFFIALIAVFATTIAIYTTSSHESITGINTLFEAFSAFATVGLSTGVSGVMSEWGKVFVILSMFIGRVGPVSLAISLSIKYHDYSNREIIPDGNIVVG